MTSAAYWDWLEKGKPWELSYPILDLATCLRGYGYTVGTIGNTSHLTAPTPEDHDPFSATGWPGPSPRWWVLAGDIMPPPAGSGLPSLGRLGAQMIADKINGLPGMGWLKYANWTPLGLPCRHESFQPGHVIRSSSDTGHIHLSCRTDFFRSRVARNYDPVARARAATGAIPVVIKPTQSGGAPKYPGRILIARTGPAMMHGTDVKQWQARMKTRGWNITVDGWYGEQSERFCSAFQRDSTAHGWRMDDDGKVGPVTWRGVFQRPIT